MHAWLTNLDLDSRCWLYSNQVMSVHIGHTCSSSESVLVDVSNATVLIGIPYVNGITGLILTWLANICSEQLLHKLDRLLHQLNRSAG